MIIYYLPSDSVSKICNFIPSSNQFQGKDKGEIVHNFPFKYRKEMVQVCCAEKNRIISAKKSVFQEYNIDGLTEIGLVVSSPSMVWIMDRWTRRIFTIHSTNNEVKEMYFGQNYSSNNNKTLRAIAIATYTVHSLILMEDISNGDTFLFGHGSNGHKQLKNDEGSSHDLNLKLPVFIPHEELSNSGSRITHISCCYSYSVCVVNNRDIHLSGQNWVEASGHSDHSWKNMVYRCTEDVISLHSGNFHFMALLKDFTIVTGGANGQQECLQPANVKYILPNKTVPYPVISITLGSHNTLLQSKLGTFHYYGKSSSPKYPDNQFKERLYLKNDRSTTISHDAVFLQRDQEVLHYKDNSMLLVMYENPCLVKYSTLPIPNPTFNVLSGGLLFYSKGSHNFQQVLYSTIYNPNAYLISDITLQF